MRDYVGSVLIILAVGVGLCGFLSIAAHFGTKSWQDTYAAKWVEYKGPESGLAKLCQGK